MAMAQWLPVVRAGSDDIESPFEKCSICQATLVDNRPVYGPRKRSNQTCLHYFHLECIRGWVKGQPLGSQTPKPTCPNCRIPLKRLYPTGHSGAVLDVVVRANKGDLKPIAVFIESGDESFNVEIRRGADPYLEGIHPGWLAAQAATARDNARTIEYDASRRNPCGHPSIQEIEYARLEIDEQVPSPRPESPTGTITLSGDGDEFEQFPGDDDSVIVISSDEEEVGNQRGQDARERIWTLSPSPPPNVIQPRVRPAGESDCPRPQTISDAFANVTRRAHEEPVRAADVFEQPPPSYDEAAESPPPYHEVPYERAEILNEDVQPIVVTADVVAGNGGEVREPAEAHVPIDQEEVAGMGSHTDVVSQAVTDEAIQRSDGGRSIGVEIGTQTDIIPDRTEDSESSEAGSSGGVIEERVSPGAPVPHEEEDTEMSRHIIAEEYDAVVEQRDRNRRPCAKTIKSLRKDMVKRADGKRPRPGFGLRARPPNEGDADLTMCRMRKKGKPEILDCKDCGKTFTNRGSLFTHRENLHLKTYYRCTKCNEKASTKSNMYRHIRKMHKIDGESQKEFCIKIVQE